MATETAKAIAAANSSMISLQILYIQHTAEKTAALDLKREKN